MLMLFETPAGFALFKVLDEGKLSKVEDLWKDFSNADKARQVVKLKAFSKFENTSEALEAATLLIDSKPSKGLRKFLKAHCSGETLAVSDSKLGNIIKEKLKNTSLFLSASVDAPVMSSFDDDDVPASAAATDRVVTSGFGGFADLLLLLIVVGVVSASNFNSGFGENKPEYRALRGSFTNDGLSLLDREAEVWRRCCHVRAWLRAIGGNGDASLRLKNLLRCCCWRSDSNEDSSR
ncbi:hypothetical protein ACFX13_015254 [Malus domestica]